MSAWGGRRVLVSGAEGFIGSHLVERLSSEGASVRAFVHYNPLGRWGWLDSLPRDVRSAVEILPGDVRDPHGVAEAVSGRDVVFHLASLIGIPYSYRSPDSYVQTNVVGTLNMLTASRSQNVARVVHTSTSEVYGTAQTVPIDESHPLQPQSPYAATKVAADMLALSFHRSFGLPVCIVRPFNTYGPRQSSRAVIPTILVQLLSGAMELNLGSLSPRRDFNFVTDTVEGFLAMAACDRALGQVVNIGSGRDVSVGELVELLMTITGRRVPIVTQDDRVRPAMSEVERLCCDYRRAQEWAGWRPRVPLEEGLRLTAEWISQHLGDYRPDRYHV